VRTTSAFSSPVAVVNTGGWVVDTPQLNPIKGAALILIDEKLNVAAVRCYTEGPDASSFRLRVEPSNPTGPNELADELRATIDPGRDPWATLAELTRAAVGDRGRELEDRLHADTSTLNEVERAEPARGPASPSA
jgi:hypothetical protein